MKCYECKGSVSFRNIAFEKKCPSCGARLVRMPPKEVLKESLITFSEDRGYFFWAIVYLFVITVFSFFEAIFGTGGFLRYISRYGFRFIFWALVAGSMLDYIIKANVEVTSVRNKYIFKPPRYLRAFRRWTNFSVFLSIALVVFIMVYVPGYIFVRIDPEHLIQYIKPKYFGFHALTAFTLIPTFVVCLFWAFLGLAITEKDFDDKRIKYFMNELRVSRAKYYNRVSAMYIGGIFIAGVIYYNLINISGLWFYIANARFVYNTTKFFKEYFGWVGDFVG